MVSSFQLYRWKFLAQCSGHSMIKIQPKHDCYFHYSYQMKLLMTPNIVHAFTTLPFLQVNAYSVSLACEAFLSQLIEVKHPFFQRLSSIPSLVLRYWLLVLLLTLIFGFVSLLLSFISNYLGLLFHVLVFTD